MIFRPGPISGGAWLAGKGAANEIYKTSVKLIRFGMIAGAANRSIVAGVADRL